jgi:hypothetical protein
MYTLVNLVPKPRAAITPQASSTSKHTPGFPGPLDALATDVRAEHRSRVLVKDLGGRAPLAAHLQNAVSAADECRDRLPVYTDAADGDDLRAALELLVVGHVAPLLAPLRNRPRPNEECAKVTEPTRAGGHGHGIE